MLFLGKFFVVYIFHHVLYFWLCFLLFLGLLQFLVLICFCFGIDLLLLSAIFCCFAVASRITFCCISVQLLAIFSVLFFTVSGFISFYFWVNFLLFLGLLFAIFGLDFLLFLTFFSAVCGLISFSFGLILCHFRFIYLFIYFCYFWGFDILQRSLLFLC